MSKVKEIQRRIKSIKNTQKITKAMEMVAAVKMRRATEAVLQTRTYANLSWTTVINLSQALNTCKTLHPLLSKREKVNKVGIVLFTSNRGLCGSYNTAIINKVHQSILKHQKNKDGEKIENKIILVGKKGISMYSRYGYNIEAEFNKADISSKVEEIKPVAQMILNGFLNKDYDKVMVAFTDYVSASQQVPRVKQILPVDLQAQDDHLGVVGQDTRVGLDKDYVKGKEEKYLVDKERKDKYVFTYEPGARRVLDEMLPRLIEVQLFQALLESNASEHSARMAAMHQANESAKDLLGELTVFYNKARQSNITSEIAEISAGANALQNS